MPSSLSATDPRWVFPSWIMTLPMQQQSVLVLACRGPDGIAKHHSSKEILRAYRACVLKHAYNGHGHVWGAPATDSFANLQYIALDDYWPTMMDTYFDAGDELPHHFRSHFMHGAEILGYKHPLEIVRRRWTGFYLRACDDLHVNPETEAQMDGRLSDGFRRGWTDDD